MKIEEEKAVKRLRKSLVKEGETKPKASKAKKTKPRLGIEGKEKLVPLKRIRSKQVTALRKKRRTGSPTRVKGEPSVAQEGNRITEDIERLILHPFYF